MPALLGFVIMVALLWPLIKIWFFVIVALLALSGFLIVLQGVLKVAIWAEERRLERKAYREQLAREEDAHMIGLAAVMEAVGANPVKLIDRGDGVLVPSRGEW